MSKKHSRFAANKRNKAIRHKKSIIMWLIKIINKETKKLISKKVLKENHLDEFVNKVAKNVFITIEYVELE